MVPDSRHECLPAGYPLQLPVLHQQAQEGGAIISRKARLKELLAELLGDQLLVVLDLFLRYKTLHGIVLLTWLLLVSSVDSLARTPGCRFPHDFLLGN